MSLQDLPLEQLAQILHYLGPIFFREDLGRLTVSKAWYAVAQGELYSALSWDSTKLHRLFQQWIVDGGAALPAWAREKLHSFTFDFDNSLFCADDDASGDSDASPNGAHIVDEGTLQAGGWSVPKILEDDNEYAQMLCTPLPLLEQLRGLRHLCVSMDLKTRNWPVSCRQCERAISRALHRISGLTIPWLRELDLRVTVEGHLLKRVHQSFKAVHFCRAINQLLVALTGLEVVHLALGYLCPALFKTRRKAGSRRLRKLHVECNHNGSRSPCELVKCKHVLSTELVPFSFEFSPQDREEIELAKEVGQAAKQFDPALDLSSSSVFRILWGNHRSHRVARFLPESKRQSACYVYAWDCLAEVALTYSIEEDWDSLGVQIDIEEDYKIWGQRQRGLLGRSCSTLS